MCTLCVLMLSSSEYQKKKNKNKAYYPVCYMLCVCVYQAWVQAPNDVSVQKVSIFLPLHLVLQLLLAGEMRKK